MPPNRRPHRVDRRRVDTRTTAGPSRKQHSPGDPAHRWASRLPWLYFAGAVISGSLLLMQMEPRQGGILSPADTAWTDRLQAPLGSPFALQALTFHERSDAGTAPAPLSEWVYDAHGTIIEAIGTFRAEQPVGSRTLRVRLRFKTGPILADSALGVTDYEASQAAAQWDPGRDEEIPVVIHLDEAGSHRLTLAAVNLQPLIQQLAAEKKWPWLLEVTVTDPARSGDQAVLGRATLPILSGD